jgi:hypothetical protein
MTEYICALYQTCQIMSASSAPVGYVNTGSSTTSPSPIYVQAPSVSVMLQPDPNWVYHNVLPLGAFSVELAIAIAILAGARCMLQHFGVRTLPSAPRGKK